MKEIKFRGKSLITKEWIVGSLVKVVNENYIVCFDEMELDGHHIRYTSDRPVFTDQNTIGQFTGLYDKRSKEVYEHDILRVFDGERYFNVTVVWSDKAMAFMCCFCDNNLSPLSWFSNILSKGYEIEVIGNIYDNKELLNQE